jgi:hypothetical protein
MVGVDVSVMGVDAGGVMVEMRLGARSRDGVGRSRSPRGRGMRSSSGEGQRSHVRWCGHDNGRDSKLGCRSDDYIN